MENTENVKINDIIKNSNYSLQVVYSKLDLIIRTTNNSSIVETCERVIKCIENMKSVTDKELFEKDCNNLISLQVLRCPV